MKKFFILSVAFLSVIKGNAQVAVADTGSTGAGYVNQTFYKLEDGSKTTVPNAEWDLGFQTGLMTVGVHANTAAGITVYKYPNGAANNNDFANFDTTGYTSWPQLHNSETSWDLGAFNTTNNPNNQFDYGWGNYDMVTHNVTGDSLFLIKKGNNFGKLWIVSKPSNNSYIFKVGLLDNSATITDTILCANYNTKNLVYYSLTTFSELDREPASANWDLLFTRYTSLVMQPTPTFYNVTGVLTNAGVQVAKVTGVEDVASFIDTTGAGFSTNISVIGYDWKNFNGSAFVIEDSLVYFVVTNDDQLWKLVFTGFGGSANGDCIFTKQKLTTTTAIAENAAMGNVLVYPNPAAGNETITLVYNLTKNTSDASYTIFDMTGKMVERAQINGTSGLHTEQINTANMAPGMYMVNFIADNTTKTLKLIVR